MLKKSVFILLSLFLLILILSDCEPGGAEAEDGTFTLNITGAQDYANKRVYYTIQILNPEDTSAPALATYEGYWTLSSEGELHATLADPADPGTDLIIEAEKVVYPYVFIDVNDSGGDTGDVDWAMNHFSQNMDGGIVINAVYPDDFYLSETVGD